MRVVFLETASDDLETIALYIDRQSQILGAGRDYAAKIIAYCHNLADLPGMFGRARPERRPGLRSVTFDRYVIFLRYFGEPRHTLEIVNVLHGARDIEAFFADD